MKEILYGIFKEKITLKYKLKFWALALLAPSYQETIKIFDKSIGILQTESF
jgi:hypothetical protein